MKVVITGGAGFIGTLLARRLIERGELTGPDGQVHPVDALVLFDTAVPADRPQNLEARVSYIAGEIADAAAVRVLIDRPDLSVFHLASVVSGGGERDFDLAMRVNLNGHLHVLEAARALGSRPRVVFASSIAVFGGSAMPEVVGDRARQTPQTTYGMTKAVGELLVNDYTRKGFIDGRSARLPTVIIRPGAPNQAASSFASGVFREPLNGVACRLPVARHTVMPVAGYRTVTEGFLRLHELDGGVLGDDRSVGFPALEVSVDEMIASLARVAGPGPVRLVREARDPAIERIVATWPAATECARALSLGLPSDDSLDRIVQAYIEDFAPIGIP